MDYVALVDPEIVGNEKILKWKLVFTKGSGYNQNSAPIYCDTAEQAFDLVDHYNGYVKFDDLMKALFRDQNQPSEFLYSNDDM
jgi:hypothetical protein